MSRRRSNGRITVLRGKFVGTTEEERRTFGKNGEYLTENGDEYNQGGQHRVSVLRIGAVTYCR